jgi:hypothetical protein
VTTSALPTLAAPVPLATVPAAPPVGAVRFGQRVQRALQRFVYKMGPPQFTLMNVVADRWRADALGAITRLGVPEALAAGARPADRVAAELGLHPDALHRVLRALARDGLLDEGPGGVFGLNALTRPLLRDHPSSMRHMVMELSAPRNAACWSRLAESLRTGEAAWPSLHPEDMWTWLEQHPEEHAIFHGAMEELTREGAPAYARGFDFGRFDSVVDLGGGTGTLIAAILSVHRTLRGVLVDAPSVVDRAGPTLARYGVQDRCEAVGADVFEGEVPAGKGVYVAKNILHGMSDERLVGMLTRWRRAMRTDSRLVVIDVVVPEADEPYLGFLDLQMLLVSFGGRERTQRQFESLFAASGLALESVVQTATPMAMVVARPV